MPRFGYDRLDLISYPERTRSTCWLCGCGRLCSCVCALFHVCVCLCAVWAVWLCVAVCGCVAVWLCAVCCVLHATATAQTMQLELGSPEAAFIAFMVFMAFAAFVAFVLFTVAGLLLADAMASTSESCDAGS